MRIINTKEWYKEVENHFNRGGGEWNFELLEEMAERLDMEKEWKSASGDFEPLAWQMFKKLSFNFK